jgi:D-alanyl-lipoteichoic acid acyltransferase DltB (MBOAT superfamily)
MSLSISISQTDFLVQVLVYTLTTRFILWELRHGAVSAVALDFRLRTAALTLPSRSISGTEIQYVLSGLIRETQ